VSRRKRRREKSGKEEVQQSAVEEVPRQVESAQPRAFTAASAYSESSKTAQRNEDGSASLEDMFGLGNDQLRELMEQELPVPREDLITRKEVKEESKDQNKVFQLPDLGEFMSGGSDNKQAGTLNADGSENLAPQRIDRSNQAEYLRVLQLNPFADADETMFLDEYDILPSIFGSGKLLGIPVPYLQTGHGILLVISLLAALVYAPGNPLTEFPPEIRSFLKQGLMVTYSINVVLAVQAFFNAKEKRLPSLFWAAKCFLLGGVAYYEITQAKDPSKINEPADMSSLSDRKSKNRRKT